MPGVTYEKARAAGAALALQFKHEPWWQGWGVQTLDGAHVVEVGALPGAAHGLPLVFDGVAIVVRVRGPVTAREDER